MLWKREAERDAMLFRSGTDRDMKNISLPSVLPILRVGVLGGGLLGTASGMLLPRALYPRENPRAQRKKEWALGLRRATGTTIAGH